MKRSPATEIRHLRRALREACALLDDAAADLSACARIIDRAGTLDTSRVRDLSSTYALAAHRLTPRRKR